MEHLFEFGKWLKVEDPGALKLFLQYIHQQQFNNRNVAEPVVEESDPIKQPFIQFDGDFIRPNNYCGFIQHGKQLIEIYPKVFRRQNCDDKNLMLRHLFFWLDYCRKWRFPFSSAHLGLRTVDSFPELIIYLMVQQIHETISQQSYLQYESVEESLQQPRGKINFSRYVKNGLSRGRGHMLECDYEPFIFDNAFNRLIKFCLRKLSSQTSLSENLQIIDQCLMFLDEVEDTPCSMSTVRSIRLNTFIAGYPEVLELCKQILELQTYDNGSYDLEQWCLLFPMEYIFEDFVAGFLEQNFSDDWKIEYQKSDAYLSDEPKVFNMQHDIFLSRNGRRIIIDTKYKMRDPMFKKDPKKGVLQNDVYQVLSYAFKRGCNEVLLLYPNIDTVVTSPDVFRINTPFSNSTIKVTAAEIPFWSDMAIFADMEDRLKTFFIEILK